MNNGISIVENNNTTLNRDIIISDLEGNTKVIVKCYCTITKSKSMSYYIDIIEKEIYLNNKEQFQLEVDKWIADAKTVATTLEVPYII